MNEHCATCRCTDEWPELPTQQPAVPVLSQIRHRRVIADGDRLVRLGGAEPKAIVAETREFVVYRVWSSKGADLGERCMGKQKFERTFERRT